MVTAPCPQLGPPALVEQMESRLTKQLAARIARIKENRGRVLTPDDRDRLSNGVQASADKWLDNYFFLLSILSNGKGMEETAARDAIKVGDFAHTTLLLGAVVNRADIDLQRRAQVSYGLGILEMLRDGPEKALPHFEQAARLDPEVPDYYASVAELAILTNRHDYAETTWNIIMALGQRKTATDPANGKATIGRGLNGLADFYLQTGRRSEAIKAYEDALLMFRDADKISPGAFNWDLVQVFDSLGPLQAEVGNSARAREIMVDTLATYRILAASDPAYRGQLGYHAEKLGLSYLRSGEYAEAEKFYLEALAIYRVIDSEKPSLHLPAMANAMTSLAVIYDFTERSREAYEMNQEVLKLYREMNTVDSEKYQGEIARILLNLGAIRYSWNQLSEAKELFEAALAIGRERAKTIRDDSLSTMAVVLTNLGNVYCDKGRGDDSKAAFYEAFDIYTELNQRYQNAYQRPLESLKAKILKRKTCFP